VEYVAGLSRGGCRVNDINGMWDRIPFLLEEHCWFGEISLYGSIAGLSLELQQRHFASWYCKWFDPVEMIVVQII